jgi:hypothetical protein
VFIKKIAACLNSLFLAGVSIDGATEPVRASVTISSASIILSSAMEANFSCSTNCICDISVKSVKLEEKSSSGTWSQVTSLAAPAGVKNALSLCVDKNYKASCTKGKTYRISATFVGGDASVSRTSAGVKYT